MSEGRGDKERGDKARENARGDKERGDKERGDKERKNARGDKARGDMAMSTKAYLTKIKQTLIHKKNASFQGRFFLSFVKCFHLALFALQIKLDPVCHRLGLSTVQKPHPRPPAKKRDRLSPEKGEG
jgi:hypothetical protein